MNKKYMFVLGKVIIEDEENKKKIGEYYNDLNDVLIEENIVEMIEDKINKLIYRQKQLEKNHGKKHFIPWEFIIMCVLLMVIFLIYTIYSANSLEIYVTTFLKQTSVSFWLFSSSVPLLIASLDTIIDYFKYKHHKKTLNGIRCELTYLKKELLLSKKKLEDLKNKQTFNKYTNIDFIDVNDQERIESLTKNSKYYFLEGYNQREEKNKVLKKVKE